MKYIKAKEIINDITTIRLQGENIINYHKDNDYSYYGVNVDDVQSFLVNQPAEIEAVELSYEEIKPILKECALMKSYDEIIEREIAKRYSVGKELKMRDLPITDPDRIEYENYKAEIKEKIKLQKKEVGLIQ